MKDKKTEALKLALEVSEEFIADYQSEDGMNSMKHYAKKHHAVLTASRAALAEQPAQQQSAERGEPVAGKGKEFSDQLKLCARNVAFAASGHVDMSLAAMQEMFALIDHVCVGLDSPPAQQQEPVSGVVIREGIPTLLQNQHIKSTDVRLYTSPPASKPLTDEQIDAIWDAVITPSNHIREFVRAIEAAHGIKEKP